MVATPTLQGGSTGPIGSLLINLGGNGECGWRSLAFMISTCNRPGETDKVVDNIETLSTTLRVKVTNFLKVNCCSWKGSWCPDPSATRVAEDGCPATTLEEFLQVLERPKRWLCGLGLTGCALMQQCSIVIWQFSGTANETTDQKKWHRVAIISDNGKHPIIPLVLHKGHYFGLRLPPSRKSWPREWLSTLEDEKEVPITQNVDEAGGLSHLCRGGGERQAAEHTPVRQKLSVLSAVPALSPVFRGVCSRAISCFSGS